MVVRWRHLATISGMVNRRRSCRREAHAADTGQEQLVVPHSSRSSPIGNLPGKSEDCEEKRLREGHIGVNRLAPALFFRFC